MTEIEWTDWVQPVLHRDMVEVTEGNVIEICKLFGWSMSFREEKCAPYPDGREMVTVVTISRGRTEEKVPFWIRKAGDTAYSASRPGLDWKKVNDD